MNKYNLFNPIMLNFFDMSNTFDANIWVVHTFSYFLTSILDVKRV